MNPVDSARSRAARAVKRTIAPMLYGSGALRLWARVALRNRAVVLMYHRVLTEDERKAAGSHPGIVVTVDTFSRHVALLRRHFQVLSLAEFARHVEERRPFARPSCLITFDDGWSDNFHNALPILRKHGAPAAVFLPVGYTGARKLFWREALTQVVVASVTRAEREPGLRQRLDALLRPLNLADVLNLRGTHARAAIIETIAARTHATSPISAATIAALAREVGVEVEAFSTADGFITWEQAAEMQSGGITFGGHGTEHVLLTRVPEADAEREIATSASVLRQRLGSEAAAFSYPNGDWNPRVAGLARKHGFRLAFSTQPGPVRCDDDPLSLRRINVHEAATETPGLFLSRLVGLF